MQEDANINVSILTDLRGRTATLFVKKIQRGPNRPHGLYPTI